MCFIYQIECRGEKCCPANPVESPVRTGIFIKPFHIIDTNTVPVNQDRNRISTVILDCTGCGMIGTDNDYAIRQL
jgi:hypothetical protein